ncbi:hypothetical protein [Amedibacillus sp. YH-ame10]
MEQKETNVTKESYLKNYEEDVLITTSFYLNLIEPFDGAEYNDRYRMILKYWEWLSQLKENALNEMKTKHTLQEYKQIKLIVQLKYELMTLNTLADGSDKYPYFEDAYKGELSTYKNTLNLDIEDFDVKKFSIIGGNSIQREEEYFSQRNRIDYYFYLYENNMVEITLDDPGPWSFLAYQFSDNNYMELLFLVMGLMYALTWVVMLRKNNLMYLLCLQPLSLCKIICREILVATIQYICILSISLAIPFLISGILHGFQYPLFPVFIYDKGLLSFTTFEHSKLLEYFDFSYVPSKIMLSENSTYLYIPQDTSITSLLSYVSLSMLMLFLKITTYITILMSSTFWFKKFNVIMGVGTSVIAIFLISQVFYPSTALLNVFAIESGYKLLGGGSIITYFHACVLCAVSLLLMFFTNLALSKKVRID